MARRSRSADAALIPATSVNPITGETSRETWRRWSLERAERERKERHREKAMAQAESERGVYALEVARTVAQRHAQTAPPEWRFLKDLIVRDFGRILRQQPEMRDIASRERLFAAVAEGLPVHIRPAAWELKTMMELFALARESTAFLLGFEIGRESGHRAALRDPRVMLAPTADRKRLPLPRPSSTLRLHDGDVDRGKGGAR